MIPFLKKKPSEEYVECFFCDVKPTKEQAFDFQYKADEVVHTVKICPLCAGIFNNIMDERDEEYE